MVFDLDDTLYLERKYVRSGFRQVGNEIRKRFSLEHFEGKAWALFLDGQRQHIFDEALSSMGIPHDSKLIRGLVDIYRNHNPNISLEPDAATFFETVSPQCRLALITDGPVETQRRKIEALRLGGLIPIRVFTWAWGEFYSKPHPRAFEVVQRELNAAPAECAYVGDNPGKDFITPQNLGWTTIRIRRPEGLHSHVESGRHPTDYEFETLAPLQQLCWVTQQ